MIVRLQQFWGDRSLRERQLLIVMSGLFAVLVIVFGIVRPLSSATTVARDRLDRVAGEAGQIAGAADLLVAAKGQAPARLNGALAVVVGDSATAAGFTLATLDRQGDDRVNITIAAAKSPALFAWLRSLAKQGIFVDRMTIRTNADMTLAVDGTLRARTA